MYHACRKDTWFLPSSNEVLGNICNVFSRVSLSFCPQSGSPCSLARTCPNLLTMCTMLKHPVDSLAPLTLYGHASCKFLMGANLHFTPALSLDLLKFIQLETPQIFSNFKLLSPSVDPLTHMGIPRPCPSHGPVQLVCWVSRTSISKLNLFCFNTFMHRCQHDLFWGKLDFLINCHCKTRQNFLIPSQKTKFTELLKWTCSQLSDSVTGTPGRNAV